jgi:hypothetical protein
VALRDHAGRKDRQRPAVVAGTNARVVSRSIDGVKSWLRRRLFWVEDHPGPVVGALTTLWLFGWGSAVLLLNWALVVSLAIQVAAALTIAVVTVSAALAVFRWLKRRRDRRPADSSPVPPALQASSIGAGTDADQGLRSDERS